MLPRRCCGGAGLILYVHEGIPYDAGLDYATLFVAHGPKMEASTPEISWHRRILDPRPAADFNKSYADSSDISVHFFRKPADLG
jgi:hypothetical protein